MVLAFLFVTFFWLFLLLAGWRFITNKLRNRRKSAIADLRAYRNRAHIVVSELMARANELDQHRHYVVLPADSQVSHKLAAVCQDLVVLSESLPMIDNLLKEGNIKHGRRDMLITLNAATQLNRHLDGVSQQLKLASDEQVMQQPKTAQSKRSDI